MPNTMPYQSLTPMQAVQVGAIYEALARLLPIQGRDYTVDITFEDGKPAVQMAGLTPFGGEWARYCMTNLQAAIVAKLREENDRRSAMAPIQPSKADGAVSVS